MCEKKFSSRLIILFFAIYSHEHASWRRRLGKDDGRYSIFSIGNPPHKVGNPSHKVANPIVTKLPTHCHFSPGRRTKMRNAGLIWSSCGHFHWPPIFGDAFEMQGMFSGTMCMKMATFERRDAVLFIVPIVFG